MSVTDHQATHVDDDRDEDLPPDPAPDQDQFAAPNPAPLDADAMDATQLAAAILGFQDRRVVYREVPEWGGVRLALVEPSIQQRTLFGLWAHDNGGGREAMFPAVVAMCASHPDTLENLWTLEDLQALAAKNGSAMERLGKECMDLAGMTDEAAAEGKGDSPVTRPSGSSSS